jgi:putative copper resistance protein D|tara:strand:+ start:128 stop:1036 length:909 start_codon:yes stop_codon:yes gene_type:complete
MFSVPTSWELTSLVCKLLLYFGAASIAGGSLCLWLYNNGKRQFFEKVISYIMLGAFLGFLGTLVNYFVQVGLINARGLTGMFDWDMASLLLETQLGEVTYMRLTGFILAFISSLIFFRKAVRLPQQSFYRLLLGVHGIAFLFVAFSFTKAGHVSVLTGIARTAVVFHLYAFSAWVGSLFPLLLLTNSTELNLLKKLMQQFGDNALGIVIILAGMGALMLLELLDNPAELYTTPYGWVFLLKLFLVLVTLSVAVINKLVLVPAIVNNASALRLRRSIRVEMVAITLVLIATSYLSTIVGPAGH